MGMTASPMITKSEPPSGVIAIAPAGVPASGIEVPTVFVAVLTRVTALPLMEPPTWTLTYAVEPSGENTTSTAELFDGPTVIGASAVLVARSMGVSVLSAPPST